MRVALGALVRTRTRATGAPEDRPMGRAALRMAARGVDVVFGDDVDQGRLSGFVARAGRWEAVQRVAIAAAYDRFPARLDPERHAAMCAALGDVPLGNPPAVMWLCQDKLATAQLADGIGVRTPEVEDDPARFEARVADWGAAYLKPRYGTAGRGVSRIVAGNPIPPPQHYPEADADGPRFLQRAIAAPGDWRGVAVRALAQRAPDGEWILATPVARRSRDDWVVNAERGAEVAVARDVLPASTMRELGEACMRTYRALGERPDGEHVLEVGIDLVVDRDGHPWLVELNARPRGRLHVLAAADPERFAAEHDDALARPFERLLALVGARGGA